MNAQEIEDGVFVPRGLLGAARYAILHKCAAPNTYAKLGEYVYPNGNASDADVLLAADKESHQIEVDRDIKAANLQLLVDKVMAAVPCVDDVADCVELRELEELARSLKQ